MARRGDGTNTTSRLPVRIPLNHCVLFAENKRIELFDLKTDISETTDLSAEHPKVVARHTDKYNEWLDEMAKPVSNQPKRWRPDAVTPNKKRKFRKNNSK